MRTPLVAMLLIAFARGLAPAAFAQEADDRMAGDEAEILAGHSYHGEAFNEGPRQRAYPMDGLGRVDFPVATKEPRARQFVEQGVAQLHGFWYFEAERSFRQAAAIDPECAMAYWGMALANENNERRAKGFIAEAVERKDAASRRERLYIEALNAYLGAEEKDKAARGERYAKALERLLYEFPDDVEAKAFLALQLWDNRSKSKPIASFLAVDALLDQVFATEPLHPAHHYRIHLWDAEKPEKALASAALCGQSLPAVAHMWHMPGHIFSKLKRYDDAAWQQEASARVDHAHMIRDGVMPDQIHNFAHNNEWLIRNLNHVGRVRDAVDLAKNMVELPRHPKYNVLSKSGSARYGRTRLFETLDRYERWDELIALCDTPNLAPTDDVREQIKRLRHLGRAHFRLGHSEAGETRITAIRTLLDQQKTARDEAAKKAEREARAPSADANESSKPRDDVATDDSATRADGNGPAPEKKEDSRADDKKIKDAIDRARKPFDDAIKEIDKALHELEGLRLWQAGNAAESLERLKKAGDVDPLLLARVRIAVGEADAALRAARKHVDGRANEVQPLAVLAELYWQADRKDDARKTFERLRRISGSIDLESPVFERLAPLAAAFEFPADWRIVKPPRDDVGERPDLDSLGPFRWQPSKAPHWSLRNGEGSPATSKEFRGRPVILIFYLGYGCLHCAEQLQAFGPEAGAFREAGIELVAISTDDVKYLKKSIDNYEGGDLPIRLLADANHEAFRAFRAYDDFEDQPLHGTFLIDAEGRIRWQDIGHEPFMDPVFLLDEARRLLGQ